MNPRPQYRQRAPAAPPPPPPLPLSPPPPQESEDTVEPIGEVEISSNYTLHVNITDNSFGVAVEMRMVNAKGEPKNGFFIPQKAVAKASELLNLALLRLNEAA